MKQFDLPVGNLLDVEVAKKLGQTSFAHFPPVWEDGFDSGDDGAFVCPICKTDEESLDDTKCCKKYSSDMTATWEASAILSKAGWKLALKENNAQSSWVATLTLQVLSNLDALNMNLHSINFIHAHGQGRTAMEAICRAIVNIESRDYSHLTEQL